MGERLGIKRPGAKRHLSWVVRIAGGDHDPTSFGHLGQQQPRQQVVREVVDRKRHLEAVCTALSLPKLRPGVEHEHVDLGAAEVLFDRLREIPDALQRVKLKR